ncbi:MAG TPA: glycosyltransferase family 2 protein [Mucilaginibacter sp.]|jgi:glycosyltransferase involved in cell wall biosynthesis
MPRKNVSVILTTFNGAVYIKKQIESILNQTVPPDEIIVCDDNSTDDTVFKLNSFLDKRIKVFVNTTQLGVVENFKKAATLAQPGNWLAFADQDDIWQPQKLNRLIDAMHLIDDGKTPSLIYSDLAVIDKNDDVISPSFWGKQKIFPEKIRLATLLYGNVVTGCTTLINYSMAEEFFCMENNVYLHDEWLSLIAYSFGRVKFLKEKLVLYRQHENNITFSENYKIPGIIGAIKDNFNYLIKKKKFLSHQFGLAKAFLLQYRHKLDNKQIRTVENFLKLERKNYLVQRINRLITYL